MAKNGKFNVKNASGAYDQVYLETIKEQVVDLDVMTGATASADGEEGLVPAPAAGEEEYFLRGDGTWAEASDTRVTNTLARTTRAYVTGTTSATTSTGTQVFDTGVYLGTTAGELNATTFVGDLTGNATSATTAAKVGSATVGSGVNPIYLSGGEAKASSSDVGSGVKPVYLSSGVITVSSSTVGDSATPVYLNGGTLTACSNVSTSDTKVTNTLATTTKAYVTGTTSSSTSTGTQVFDTGVYLGTTAGELNATTFVGDLSGNATSATTATKVGSATVGSGKQPIYLASGVATASGSDVGSSSVPMYLASGVMTACGYSLSDLQSSLDTLSENTAIYIAASEADSSGGYVKLSNGFIFQYGTFSGASSSTDIYLETAFASTSYQIYFASSRVSVSSRYKAYFKISVADDDTESGGSGTISSTYWAFGV